MRPDRSRAARRRLLTINQVATLLCVPPATIRHWIGTGQLPAVKVDRDPRVRVDDLLLLLTSPAEVEAHG